MKRCALIIIMLVAASTWPAIITTLAQAAMAAWPSSVELSTPAGPGAYEVVLPLRVMDQSREDLADLRLSDTNGREIPYALRIRREVDDTKEVPGQLFNLAHVGTTASQILVDLGDNSGTHNQLEIETAGTNFRRRVEVEGSQDKSYWSTLTTDAVVFSFESQNKTIKSDRVSYPTSTYQYLTIKVFADEVADKQAPVIAKVTASMMLREKVELSNWDVPVPAFQSLRIHGAPASAWTVDLGGRVPCDRLALTIYAESFSRPFQLEAVDDPQNIRLVASGELTRRIGEQQTPVVINFDQEEHARKLRLLVTDYNNETLPVSAIMAGAPARQLVFELKEPVNQPLRLFFGNPKATAPHYDFEKDLSARITRRPVRAELGSIAANPDYKPEPLPLTERIPWLIYVVLTASSLALAFILISLVRTTLRSQPKNTEGSSAT